MKLWPMLAEGFSAAAVAMLPSWLGERSAGDWHRVKDPVLEPPLGVPVLSSQQKLPQLEKQMSSPMSRL